MVSKKAEQDTQFSLWFFASIFLHILLLLIILIFYFQSSIKDLFIKKHSNPIPQKLTPEQLQQYQQQQELLQQLKKEEEEKKKAPILWKDLKKPKPQVMYDLIPGRQAVTEEKKEKKEEKKSLEDKEAPTIPKPETTEPKKTAPEPIPKPEKAPQVTKELIAKKNIPDSVETPQQRIPIQKNKKGGIKKRPETKLKELIPSPKEIMLPKASIPNEEQRPAKTVEQRHDEIKNKLLQEVKEKEESDNQKGPFLLSEKTTSQEKQIDSTKNPTIVKQKVTLQDLKLGFAKYMQEGNNDILIQRGNTNQPPDAQALRLITYHQQLAHTMRSAITSHHQYRLLTNIRGARPTYKITIDRSGKLLDLVFTRNSGNELLDKIMLEALQSIKLYPAVPQYVSGDTYSQLWTYIF